MLGASRWHGTQGELRAFFAGSKIEVLLQEFVGSAEGVRHHEGVEGPSIVGGRFDDRAVFGRAETDVY